MLGVLESLIVALLVRPMGLLDQAFHAHHLVGHRWLHAQVGLTTRPITGESSLTARNAARRYGAI
jgi:hypothetical protein